jgi:hypothetical protein
MAHWLLNVGVYSARDPDYPRRGWMNPLLWLLVTLVLFRFWPAEDTDLTAWRAESVDTSRNAQIASNGGSKNGHKGKGMGMG